MAETDCSSAVEQLRSSFFLESIRASCTSSKTLHELPLEMTAAEFSAADAAISIDRGQRADFEHRTLAMLSFPNRFQDKVILVQGRTRTS